MLDIMCYRFIMLKKLLTWDFSMENSVRYRNLLLGCIQIHF